MPASSALTERAWALLEELPGWLREDPDIRAVIYATAQEFDRIDEQAREVRDQLIPTRVGSLGLSWWEGLLRLSTESGDTDEAPRARVLGALQAILSTPSGSAWEAAATALIGPGWSYVEDPATYTITITVPFAPGTEGFLRLERQLRRFTPAHLDLVISSGEGFVLDQSQLDQEQFHPS